MNFKYQLPNFLSAFRLIVGLAYLAFGQIPAPFSQIVILLIALFSDVVDGWIARKLSVNSTFGALLDSSADKIFIFSIFLKLTIQSDFPVWVLVVISVQYLIIGIVGLNFSIKQQKATKPGIFARVSSVFAGITAIIGVLVPDSHNLLLLFSYTTIVTTFLHIVSTLYFNLLFANEQLHR